MNPPIPWLSRIWDYQIDPRLLPCILDRLAGVPARIEDKISGISPENLIAKPGGKWSIQEHIGHLLDLEELGLGRIEDFRSRQATLRGWDIANQITQIANHNDRPITALLADFRAERERMVAEFWKLDDAALEWVAFHPRLQKPMRVADFAHFHAEHDDHHLAWMAWLAYNLREK
jgi:hypothetical protein